MSRSAQCHTVLSWSAYLGAPCQGPHLVLLYLQYLAQRLPHRGAEYVPVCIYVYICIHICIHVYLYVCMCICIGMFVCIFVCICVFMFIYIYKQILCGTLQSFDLVLHFVMPQFYGE